MRKWHHILRRQNGSHRLFTSWRGKKKKKTEPQWSVNLIKITNAQFLKWVTQFTMQKLYRSTKADDQPMGRLEQSPQMCVSATPSGTGATPHKTRENNPYMLPLTPVTPFNQATCLSPLSSRTALTTPLASPQRVA